MRKSTDSSPLARKSRKTGRRSPLASIALILIGLVATGGAYALFSTTASASTTTADQQLLTEGSKLFQANCATCHGLNLEGTNQAPSLLGVGAASVQFQVSTGRMPAAASGPQEEQKTPQFTDQQVYALAEFVGSKAPGPAIPSKQYLGGTGNASKGAE